MSLRVPSSSLNETFKISTQNLTQILNVKNTKKNSVDQFITNEVRLYLNEIQNAQLGWSHFIKKHAIGAAVHGAILAAPVSGALGGVYYFSDEIKKIEDPANAVIVGAGIAGAYVADIIVGKILGIRPVTLAVVTVYEIFREGARRISKEVLASYNRKEEETHSLIKQLHEKNKQILSKVYEGVGQELVKQYELGYQDPKVLKEIQALVQKLDASLSMICKDFSQKGFTSSEIIEILHPLKDVIELIDTNNITFRSTNSDEDKEFNAKLMAQFTESEFANNAISQEIREHIEEASNNCLGIGHTITAYASTLAVGSMTLVALPALSALGAYIMNKNILESANEVIKGTLNDQTKPIAAAMGGIALTTLAIAAKLSSDSYESYSDERAEHDAAVERNISIATKELKDIYEGIADYLLKCRDSKLAEKIEKKLPILHCQIATTNLVKDPLEITKKLREALATIASIKMQEA